MYNKLPFAVRYLDITDPDSFQASSFKHANRKVGKCAGQFQRYSDGLKRISVHHGQITGQPLAASFLCLSNKPNTHASHN